MIGELLYIEDDFVEADPAVGDFIWMVDAYEDIHEGFDWLLSRNAEFHEWLRAKGDVE